VSYEAHANADLTLGPRESLPGCYRATATEDAGHGFSSFD
jgi:hypothetical protein